MRISDWSSDVCSSDLFSTGRYNGDMNAYIASVLKAIGGDANLTPGTIQRTTVNGIPAYYTTVRANSQSGQVDVTVFAYEFSRSSAFHFVAQIGRAHV